MNIETWLREIDPARRTDAPGPDSEIGRSIYQRAIAEHATAGHSSAGHGLAPSGGGNRRSPRRRIARASLLAIVPVVVAVVLLATLLPGGQPPAPSVAAATFHRLSLTATTVPTALGPGQYYYTETERQTYQISVGGGAGPSFNEYLDGTVQTWVAADGSGRLVTTTDPTPRFPTPADRAAWVAAGRPPAAVPPDELTTVQQLGPNSGSEVNGPIPLYDVSGLPTDPTALARVLSRGEKPGDNLASLPKGISSLNDVSDCDTQACALFERAVSLLQGPDIGATAALRAALYQVLSTVPGVRLLGPTTDPVGRRGIGVSYVEHRPGGSSTMVCSTAPPGATPVHLSPSVSAGGAVVTPRASASHTPRASASTPRASADTPGMGTATPTTITFEQPASTTTFTVVIDPQSATVLSSEEGFTPLLFPNPPDCGGANGKGTSTPSARERPPVWHAVLGQGIVGSDTAVPPGS